MQYKVAPLFHQFLGNIFHYVQIETSAAISGVRLDVGSVGGGDGSVAAAWRGSGSGSSRSNITAATREMLTWLVT
jgi:L-aminopeptidase/D-esterase-like protein